MKSLSLAQKVLALTGTLGVIPHAFGGALALAYYAEARATIDIDLNVFVLGDRFTDLAKRLAPLGVDTSPNDGDTAALVQR
ncbi:MAG: hypothetical protein ACSLFB_05250, partial [Acidimicrobiales bacterium]